MKLTGKLNAGMANFTQNMKNAADNCKLDGKIADQQRKIRGLTREIGNLAVVRLEAGDEMSPEIMERYAAIKEARETISELEKKKIISSTVCPSCGAKTSISMKFCGRCGARMKEEA
ncbi:MAG: zinc-ribbon domain-containing protein [Roseburia sp.]